MFVEKLFLNCFWSETVVEPDESIPFSLNQDSKSKTLCLFIKDFLIYFFFFITIGFVEWRMFMNKECLSIFEPFFAILWMYFFP